MLKTLALTLTLLLSFTMAACSSTSGTNAKIDQTTTNAAQTAPTDAVQRIRLTLANQDELILKLNGTRAAEDFLSLLPLELTCKDFNNTEKVAYLPRRWTHRALLPVLILKQAVLLIMHLGVIWHFFTVITVMPTASLNLVLVESGIEKLAAFDNDFTIKLGTLCPKTELA